jgi:hypothetical protein
MAISGFCPLSLVYRSRHSRRRHDVSRLGVPDTSHTRRAFGRDLLDFASLIRATLALPEMAALGGMSNART